MRGKIIVSDAPVDSPFPTGIRVEVRSLNRPDPFAGEGRVGQAKSTEEFSIEDLFSDDYNLRVTGLPRGYYIKTVFQASRDVTNEPIHPGDDLTITLSSDGPVITGETVNKDNTPVRDATVILIPKDQSLGSILSIRSGHSGRFQFQSGIAALDKKETKSLRLVVRDAHQP